MTATWKLVCAVGLAVGALTSCQGLKASESPKDSRCAKGTPPPSTGSVYGLTGATGTWQAVKAIIQTRCASCHGDYLQHERAKAEIVKMIRATDKEPGDRLFMPQ